MLFTRTCEMKFFVAFLASIVLTSTVRPATATRAVAGAKKSEFVKSSCVETPYPILCSTSLSSHASEIGTDPELLAHAALIVALESAKTASAKVAEIAHNSHGLPPDETSALHNCANDVSDSVHKIKMSMVEMKQLKCPGFAAKIRNIRSYIAAAVTDYDRCTYALSELEKGEAAAEAAEEKAVKEQIDKAAHLTVNALALVNRFASTAFAGRKYIDFITTSCETTPFPNICYASLSSYACEIGGSLEKLAHTAMAVTLNTTKSTISSMVEIADRIGLSHRQNMSILVCEDLSHKSIGYVEDDLSYLETIHQIKGIDLESTIDIIKDGLIAVQNNYEWCIDELIQEEIDKRVTDAVTELMRKVEPISQIALALFSRFAKLLLP